MSESKECKVCHPEKMDWYGAGTSEFIQGLDYGGMWMYTTNGRYFLRARGERAMIEVIPNFCIACGRDLRGGERQ